MKRRLNLRFLAILVGVTACLVVGCHFLHGFQVKRTAGDLKAKALRENAAGEYSEAEKDFHRFLLLVPRDGNARADYGLCIARDAKSDYQRALLAANALEAALLHNPEREDARQKLVEIETALRHYKAAYHHVTILLSGPTKQPGPKYAELAYLRARCLDEAGRNEPENEDKPNDDFEQDSAAFWYREAKEHDPGRIDSYVRLADLYRRQLKNPRNAEDVTRKPEHVMKEMVEANKSSYEAYLARARYYRTGGSGIDMNKDHLTQALLASQLCSLMGSNGISPGALLAGEVAFVGSGPDLLLLAEQDLLAALNCAPKDAPPADVLLEAAAVARARGWVDQAEKFVALGLQEDKYPPDARMYMLAAELAVQVGQRDKALTLLGDGVRALAGTPDQLELTFRLAELLIAGGKEDELEEAQRYLTDLAKQGAVDPAILAYMHGQRLVAKEKWLEATQSLETAKDGLVQRPDVLRKCYLLLGKCYEQLQDPDQQLTAYKLAYTEDTSNSSWLPAAEGVARALLALNKGDEALDAYRKLIPRVPGARVVVARLILAQKLSLPPAQRDWKDVDDLLENAVRTMPDSVDVAVLRAQVLTAKAAQNPQDAGRMWDQAANILEAAKKLKPRDPQLWIAQAGLASVRPSGRPEEALNKLDQGKDALGDLVELRLARIRFLLLGANKDKVAADLETLNKDKDKLSSADQTRLGAGLAEAYTALGDNYRHKARDQWEAIADNNLRARLRLFDLALLDSDDSAMKDQENEIRSLEGDNGTLWRYARAARLLSEAEHKPQPPDWQNKLADARSLLKVVGDHRKNWSRVPVCQARIELLAGDLDAAIRYYLSAINDKGERDPAVLLDTVRLLRQRGRDREAIAVLQKVPDQSPLRQKLSDVDIDLALRVNDPNRALALAKEAVQAQPDDYRALLTLGQVHAARGELEEAETAIRAAKWKKDDVAETWSTLILFLVQSKQTEKAKDTIKEAKDKLPVDANLLAYARCYAAVGEVKIAGELYDAALKKAPTDPATLRDAATFELANGKREEAKLHLQELMKLKDKDSEAATAAWRLLGYVLASEPGDFGKRKKLLEDWENNKPNATGPESPDDKRARAVLLVVKGGRRDHREKAIAIIQSISDAQPLTTSDQFLQSQLHESLGQALDDPQRHLDKALDLLRLVADKEPDNPQYLETYARTLLARNNPKAAGAVLARLKELEKTTKPQSPWRTVELTARILHAQGEADEAEAVLEHYAGEPDAPLLAVGTLLEEIERTDMKTKAEKVYKRWVEANSTKQEADLILAGFYSRRNNLRKAFEFCENVHALSKTSPKMVETVISVALEILYRTDADKNEQVRAHQHIEGWIAGALNATKGDPNRQAALLQSRATLYNLQGSFDDAEKAYEACLKQQPDDILSKNNLAWLLAIRRKTPAQALALIEQAIAKAGPQRELLDTLAIVYLAQGKQEYTERAITELKEVVADRPTAAGYFHLAQAYDQVNRSEDATASLRNALKLGLKEKVKDLHPLERDRMKDLLDKYPKARDPGVGIDP